MGFLKKRVRGNNLSSYYAGLETPLLALSSVDRWNIQDAFEHTLIFGGTGSGKTSGSGRALAHAFLQAGFGGLVLCAKPEEAERWVEYARVSGRDLSIVRLDASGRYRFNFLNYLMNMSAELGGGLVDNAVNTLLRVLEAAQARGGAQGSHGDDAGFWQKAIRELLSHALGSLYHAYGRITLDEMVKLIISAPTSEEQGRDPKFQESSFCYQTMRRVFTDPAVPLPDREAALLVSYFGQNFGRLDHKTRSNIVISLTAEISPFLKGPLHTLFCTETNVIPEVTHEGAIIIVDLPIKRFEHTGAVAQMLVKYLWQKATERREIRADTRPVFLWADECQFFISDYDREFQSTARSAHAATVYITQNLPSLYAQIGGRNPQDLADAIIGNFQTKIFHSNTDHRTNQWAADTIGRAIQRRSNRNWSASETEQSSASTSSSWSDQTSDSRGTSWGHNSGSSYSVSTAPLGQQGGGGSYGISSGDNYGGNSSRSRSQSQGGGSSQSESLSRGNTEGAGWSEQMDYMIQPAFFANGLRQGGSRNNRLVTGILLQANRDFSRTGTCWTQVAFRQK
jgi:hypothetical protein